jgi:anaerobic dimethyl sulfoxide reductase subunit A
MYNPRRLLYPMKRISGTRGKMDGQFTRISWEEALTTIAQKMKQTQEKYGNYSIFNNNVLGAWQGCMAAGWGNDSSQAEVDAKLFVFGVGQGGGAASSSELTAMYDAKLIVLWGVNPAVSIEAMAGNQNGYRMRLAREMGIPIISIDPIFTESTAMIADQWIPIRHATDAAMALAVANVLFKEDLYDKDFVSKFVEPTGFQKFKDYVLGNSAGPDGNVDRTPEWAAPICGVPADTIRAFARLYASKKPVWLQMGYAVCNKIPFGENTARLGEFLQAMTGNIGLPGTQASDEMGSAPTFVVPAPAVNIGQTRGKFTLPFTPQSGTIGSFQGWKFPDAVMLRGKLDSGEITEKAYGNIIGHPPDSPLPNVKMGLEGSLVNQYGGLQANQRPQANYNYQAIGALDYWVGYSTNAMDPCARVADIVLPATVWPEMETGFIRVANTIYYAPSVAWAGEAKPLTWVHLQLAKKLGFGEQFSSKLVGIPMTGPNPDQAWNTAWDALVKDAYDAWAKANNISTSWDDFKKTGYYRFPIEPLSHPPIVAYQDQIQKGKPFPDAKGFCNHVSGKIEFYSDWLATTDMTTTVWGGPITPTGMWQPIWDSYWKPEEFKKYPLMMLTAHAMHRMHQQYDADSLTGDVGAAGQIDGGDMYQSVLFISPVDAAMRGVKDGDRVRIFNDAGEAVLTAVVKASLTPGMVHLPEGRWTNLNSAGVDVRGNANSLTYADRQIPSCAFPHTAPVQVEKF